MPLRFALIVALAAAVPAAGALPAQVPSGNALGLIDAWLAHAAGSSASFRADLRPGGDPANLPPGRFLCRSPFLGAFTYRPKTYRELSPAERRSVLCDPRFRAFLVSVREASDRDDGGKVPDRRAAARSGPEDIRVPPEEMLRPGPLWVFLPR
jgi:hypothetical protein